MLIGVVLILQGCSGVPAKQQQANVTSTPSGASVYANSVKLGVTPLFHNLYQAFPAGWSNWEYSAQGVLMVKKEGCEEFTLKINDLILSKPIHANLKCSKKRAELKQVKPAVEREKQKPVIAPVLKPASDIERRLRELEALHKKGVITQDEYKQTRQRILGEL